MGVMDDIKRAGREALEAEKAKDAGAGTTGAAGGAIADAAAEMAEAPQAAPEAEAAPADAPPAAAPAQEAAPAPAAAAPAAAKPAPKPAAKAAPKAAPKPKPKPAPAKQRTYTVRSGDTLSAIGAHFGVSWQEIARVNRIPNPDLIHPGQVFVIPD